MTSPFPDSVAAWCSRVTRLLGLTALVAAGVAADSSPRRTFDLPAQPAESALPRFAAQSRTEVLFGSQAVAGVRTNAVRGEMSVRDALARLLAGTGLKYSVNETSGAISVTRTSTRDSVPNGARVVAGAGDHPEPPASSVAPGPAGSAGVGTVRGTVVHATRGEYLAHASVRIAGTQFSATTEPDGAFRLGNVPAGTHTLAVTYTGLKTELATIAVSAGETVTRNFELVPATAGADVSVQKLDAFVVRSEREGNAKALMEQRRSMNLTNSLSSDAFGDVAEGSVGEFLKNVPGVDVHYVGPDARGPRLRGLDPNYVGVSIDGMKLSSADASQATNAGARSFSFDQVSVNSLDRIEVNYTTAADQDADAPAGTINLKTKRAFERKGRRLSWQAHFMANGDDFDWRRSYTPSDRKSFKFLPGAILEYSDVFLNNRLGLVLNLSESNQYIIQSRADANYDSVPTAADPREHVITSVSLLSVPRFTRRFTPSLTLDYKASPTLVFALNAMYNYFDSFFDTRTVAFSVPGGRASVSGNGLNDFTFSNAQLALSTNHAHKYAQTRTLSPRFEWRPGDWIVDGGFHYTISTNRYVSLPTIGPNNVPTTALTGLGLRLSRSSLTDIDWQIVQTSGRDLSNPANFTNPRVLEDARFAEQEIYQAQFNARWSTPWRLPTWLKFGGKATEDYHRFRNPNAARNWSYRGPGGGTTGSFAGVAFPENRWEVENGATVRSLSGSGPVFPNRAELARLFRERPEYFVDLSTPANFFSAYIDNVSYIKETFFAAYGMGNVRLGRVQLQAGLRWEETQTALREFQARSAAEVRSAGYTGAPANGRATTIDGLTYQFMSQPKVVKKTKYDNLFPSASAKLHLSESLQAHVGYSYTISRPPIGNLGGVLQFNENTLTATVPNPDLLPETSHNFSARLAYYFEPIGNLAVTLFQNDISNSIMTQEFTSDYFGYGDDPLYSGYRFISSANRPGTLRVRGGTVEYSQSLSFLPGLFSGLNVSASYTRTYANALRALMTPHMISGTVSYRHRGITFGVAGKWTSETPAAINALIDYRKARTMIDLNGGYQLTQRMGLFFQIRNVFNVPEYRYRLEPHYPTIHTRVGTFYTFGIKGVF